MEELREMNGMTIKWNRIKVCFSWIVFSPPSKIYIFTRYLCPAGCLYSKGKIFGTFYYESVSTFKKAYRCNLWEVSGNNRNGKCQWFWCNLAFCILRLCCCNLGVNKDYLYFPHLSDEKRSCLERQSGSSLDSVVNALNNKSPGKWWIGITRRLF